MLTDALPRAASRSLAISATIVLVAPIPRASGSSIRATIASSSSFVSFLELGSQSRRASVPLRQSISVVRGTSNALDTCLVLSGGVACVALIARYSLPSLQADCALRCDGIAVIVCDNRDGGGVCRLGGGGRLGGETRYI
jgi:hypothetical protein